MYIFSLLFPAVCRVGHYSKDGMDPGCQICPRDTYQDQPKSTSCKACPPGTTTLRSGSTKLQDCGGTLIHHFRIQQRLPLSTFDKTLLHDSFTKNKKFTKESTKKIFFFAMTLNIYIFSEMKLTLYFQRS